MGLLEGIKIIDFTTYAAGPACTRVLADWKADIIKVEPVYGEAFRVWGRLLGAPTTKYENPMFEVDNANKKGIALDLKTEEGLEILYQLLEDADVFITNYRHKALETLHLTYEELSEKFPRLVYGYLSGFGSKGPFANNPGFDVISFWARGGLMGFFGEPDAVPVSPMPATGDQVTGTYLAGGILAALYGRKKTGKGEFVETSLYHGAIWSAGLFNAASNYWENPKKSRFNPDSPLVNCFKSKDGKWFSLAIMEHERYWPILCKCINCIELASDEKFSLFKNAKKHSKEITDILDEAFSKKTMAEWKILLSEADIAFDEIFDGHDINKDEQALVNGFLRPVTMPNGNSVPLPTSPCLFKEEGVLEWNRSPSLGEHTDEVLRSLGYNDLDIKKLCEKGVIGLENAKEKYGCKYVVWEKNKSIAVIKFVRPQVLNSMDLDFLKDLSLVINEIEADEDIRVIIITGSGKAFMAGADIENFIKMSAEENWEMLKYGLDLFCRIERLKIPKIAAINGYALGAGCEMALLCDIRIADEKAKFGQPEVGLGIIPGGGGTQRLQNAVGTSNAMKMILTGEIINADAAKEMGLISQIVPVEDLMKEAISIANNIIQNAPLSVSYAYEAIKKGKELEIDKGLYLEIELFDKCFRSDDKKEGTQAFFDGRMPKFIGR